MEPKSSSTLRNMAICELAGILLICWEEESHPTSGAQVINQDIDGSKSYPERQSCSSSSPHKEHESLMARAWGMELDEFVSNSTLKDRAHCEMVRTPSSCSEGNVPSEIWLDAFCFEGDDP